MAKYKIKIGFGESEFIQREDGATIPKDEANSDYQEYLAWVDGGNTPDPEDTMSVEDEWINIREKRNELLTASDWTQGGDTPLTSAKKTEGATYRTSLRSLPEDQKDKTTQASITWPKEPS